MFVASKCGINVLVHNIYLDSVDHEISMLKIDEAIINVFEGMTPFNASNTPVIPYIYYSASVNEEQMANAILQHLEELAGTYVYPSEYNPDAPNAVVAGMKRGILQHVFPDRLRQITSNIIDEVYAANINPIRVFDFKFVLWGAKIYLGSAFTNLTISMLQQYFKPDVRKPLGKIEVSKEAKSFVIEHHLVDNVSSYKIVHDDHTLWVNENCQDKKNKALFALAECIYTSNRDSIEPIASAGITNDFGSRLGQTHDAIVETSVLDAIGDVIGGIFND